jgi:hypothetical protein
VVEQRVGRRCDRDGGARELDRGRMLPASRERLGPHATPRDRRPQVVARERLALVAQRLRVGVPAESEQGSTQ